MIYRSKKVWWGTLIIVAPSLAGIIAGLPMIYDGIVMLMGTAPDRTAVSLTIAGAWLIPIVVCAIVPWCYFSASYEITAEELVVRCGPIRLRYPLSSIAEAIPTRVPLGPAWSFGTSRDMVYIKFHKPGLPLAISPANKTEFLRELAERVPGLGGRGEGTQEDSTRLEP
jgi:hypothetical protein